MKTLREKKIVVVDACYFESDKLIFPRQSIRDA